MPLPQVQAKSGKMYDADSPQGKTILAAQGAAQSAVGSNSFIGGSSTVAAGFVLVDKHLEDIKGILTPLSEDVTSITRILLLDAEKDARSESLASADVTQDSTELAGGAGGDAGIGGAGGDDGGDDGGLGGLIGMGAGIGSFAKGLAFWANPATMIGGAAFVTFIGLLIGAGWLGAKAFKDAIPDVVEGLEALSESEVDTEKVVGIAKAIAAMGGALAAEGLGAALGSIGSLVSGVADGLGGLLGIDKRDPMEELKEFAQHEFSESEIKQIELNARGLKSFGVAMAAGGIGDAVSSVAGLVSGVADGLRALIPVEKKDPMVEMRKFADHIFTPGDVEQIKRNAAALIGFQTAMSVTKTVDLVESAADLITGVFDGLRALIPVEKTDPMVEMRKFADWKFTTADVDQIILNAGALIGFQTAMSVTKAVGVVESAADLITGVADGLRSLIPVEARDPMAEMWKFKDWKFTQKDVDQITLNAKALLQFSSTMAGAKSMGAVESVAELFGGIARGIGALFGVEKSDPMADMKEFAKKENSITEEEAGRIETNATALVNFSKAMALYSAGGAAADSLNLVGSMAKGITSFFGGTTGIDYKEIETFAASNIGELEPKITANATAMAAFATAMKGMASDKAGVEWKNIGTAILGAIGSFFGGDANEQMQENITAIEKFTEKTLNVQVVENNLSAIEKFMNFGSTLADWEPGDTGKFGDFAAGLVGISHGIRYALHGGEDEYGISGMFNDISIKPGEGLASVDFMDMQNSAKGIAVLRHSLIAQEPLKDLQDATAAMDTSTGNVTTVVNAPNNSTNTNSSQQNTYQEMNIDHNEQTGHWWSRNSDLAPY